MDIEDDEELDILSMVSDRDSNIAARELKERLKSLKTCYNFLRKHGTTLQEKINEFHVEFQHNEEEILNYLQILDERSTLFGITAHTMISLCNKFLKSAEADGHRVLKMLQFERERTRQLEKMVHDIAKQHTALERKSRVITQYVKNSISNRNSPFMLTDETDEETEKDVDVDLNGVELSEADSLHIIRKSVWIQKRKSKHNTKFQVQESIASQLAIPIKNPKKRRSRVPDRPNVSLNAWSILKNSVGKDLSKIPMPVNFNEPLSMLQRLTEEMEYAELLDAAAEIENKYEQMAYVAAFTVSAYATTVNRTGKPFNPLLYETYECDRTEDLGWRSIAEQVSHHPPISAFYCEGRGWTCWGESNVKMKFKGKNLQIVPTGGTYLKFEKSGNTYTWGKVITIVNNIIVGKMWLDQQGEVEINGLNSAAGIKCTLTYVPFSLFSRDRQRRVKGLVVNNENEPKYLVQGYWDSNIEIASVLSTKSITHISDTDDAYDFETIWTKRLPEPGSENYHNFSRFTCELNELEEGVAPTDSRLRPDLRLMEQGLWEESNVEKLRLEQKQRIKRDTDTEAENTRRSSGYIDPHEPLWFERKWENGRAIHVYNELYWEAKQQQNWSRCPDIF